MCVCDSSIYLSASARLHCNSLSLCSNRWQGLDRFSNMTEIIHTQLAVNFFSLTCCMLPYRASGDGLCVMRAPACKIELAPPISLSHVYVFGAIRACKKYVVCRVSCLPKPPCLLLPYNDRGGFRRRRRCHCRGYSSFQARETVMRS